MTTELPKEFDNLRSQFGSIWEVRTKILTRMNNSVSYFDNSYENADVSQHLDWRIAVEIIEDGGDYCGAESYEKLHPKLMEFICKEESAKEELKNFLMGLNFKSPMKGNLGLGLEAIAILNGKIITSSVGNA